MNEYECVWLPQVVWLDTGRARGVGHGVKTEGNRGISLNDGEWGVPRRKGKARAGRGAASRVPAGS